jgi:ppGpp synthetase/RelA/SpoT-type nucleotidyltranferase
VTGSQIDKLGDLLRSGRRDDVVLRMLSNLYSDYGKAAREAYGVVSKVLDGSSLPSGPSGRPPDLVQRSTKSLASIAAKLARERTRLSQMRDIIGCRIIVENLMDQDLLSFSLYVSEEERKHQLDLDESIGYFAERQFKSPFRDAVKIDRNRDPRSGYRAIHVIVRDSGVPYEIQIRTELQDRWAQLSERLQDVYPGVKYGKGPPDIQERLVALSDFTYASENDFDDTMGKVRGGDGVDPRFLWAQEQRAEMDMTNLHRLYDSFEEEYLR